MGQRFCISTKLLGDTAAGLWLHGDEYGWQRYRPLTLRRSVMQDTVSDTGRASLLRLSIQSMACVYPLVYLFTKYLLSLYYLTDTNSIEPRTCGLRLTGA